MEDMTALAALLKDLGLGGFLAVVGGRYLWLQFLGHRNGGGSSNPGNPGISKADIHDLRASIENLAETVGNLRNDLAKHLGYHEGLRE